MLSSNCFIEQDFVFFGTFPGKILQTFALYEVYRTVGSLLQFSLDFKKSQHSEVVGSHLYQNVYVAGTGFLPPCIRSKQPGSINRLIGKDVSYFVQEYAGRHIHTCKSKQKNCKNKQGNPLWGCPE